ncbi:DUF6298 domain-containing protein [Congregicoccus parvus]|uniref:DUF6298 domain-containing protein n=1 Tax=Congregicoccus parvus TaxID=3081749 RepID=UPI003FA58F1F
MRRRIRAGVSIAAFACAAVVSAKEIPYPVAFDRDGRLAYVEDEAGNRVVEFSHAGYRGGGVPLPHVPARIRVAPAEGDDGERIQAAIDHVSALPADADGIRGAVLLDRGRFEIAGRLRIDASGVVLRGSGRGADGTVLVATGTDRRALIEVAGRIERRGIGAARGVVGAYVPVGARELELENTAGLAPGVRVAITRPSPASWIEAVGMHEAPARQPYNWRAGAFDVRWDRTILEISGSRVVLDAPLTVALEQRFGGASIEPYEETGYIEDVGVENLRCESTFDRGNPFDEEHAWNAIDLHAVRDGWVSDVTGIHFAGTVVQVGALVSRVTVQDCDSLEPVSEWAGYRRMAFHSRGQQILFLRCRSEFGRHDFSVGYLAAGPNVFLECTTRETQGFSGSIGAWASGLLFDGVTIDGGALRLDNLETWNQGVGWNAANSVLWNSSASTIVCRTPPGAANRAVAVWGQFIGDGTWTATNTFAKPASLYRAQLAERLGDGALSALSARTYADESATPAWTDGARRRPESIEPAGDPMRVVDGWLVAGDRLLTGRQSTGAWWLGRLEPARAKEYGPALTRFSPGRTGTGLTDEIPALVASMVANDQVAFRHHYGLWYDRRRIDHQMIRRPDADVYPPFFEQPFARSGQGSAWDGMSRYDLTRYNPWYFERLRAFAAEARRHGRVLVSETYFQHNILESGAHWVDSPWRNVNNVNDTGFTEPPPYTGDTIRMAAEFYDVAHPVRRELHRAYIRQCLSALADEPNVIHTLTAENSGPLHFMQFWLDVVAEWIRETGRWPTIMLSAPKDVQDAILADEVRAPLIDAIDFSYWFRTDDGAEFAPPGGVSLAPRQHMRQWKGGRPSAASIAGMVREYRTRHPDKAIVSSLDQADGWLFVAAGGSFPKLPRTTDPALLATIARMRPTELPGNPVGAWALASSEGALVVDVSGGELRLPASFASASRVDARVVDPATGVMGDVVVVPVVDGARRLPAGAAGLRVFLLIFDDPSRDGSVSRPASES